MTSRKAAVVAVIGSAMTDLTCYADELPVGGQTLVGHLFTSGFGGKGANQAVMAAHCGAKVFFVGMLGDDIYGRAIHENFRTVGVDVSHTGFSSNKATGVAHIWVDGRGENRIVIIPGSNYDLDCDIAVRAVQSIDGLNVVVGQCEIRQEVTVAAFRAAKRRGVVTILNPAPYQELSQELLDLTDWIVPNETEFLELHPERLSPDSEIALTTFRPGKKSIVTLGSLGVALVSESGDVSYISAPVVDHVVDTTGAGDAFVGTFASSIGSGEDGITAATRACKVATLSVTKKGAQSSYPTPEQLLLLE